MAKTKHWAITGASRGIGLEFVNQLLQANEQVTALARHISKAEGLQKLLREYPARLKLLEADIKEDLDVDRAVKALEGQAVDILINNAGVYLAGDGQFPGVDLDLIQGTFITNTIGPMRVTKGFLPLLSKSSQPVVANISSMMGSIGDNGSGGSYGYRMSKAALNMFSKGLSIDLPNIIVLSLHPGWVQTDMGGHQAPLSKEAAVAGLLKVIRGSTTQDSGKFLTYKGESLSW